MVDLIHHITLCKPITNFKYLELLFCNHSWNSHSIGILFLLKNRYITCKYVYMYSVNTTINKNVVFSSSTYASYILGTT